MRALVTGAGARVGRAIAVELARAGFELAIHYNRSAAGAEETLRQVRDAGSDGWLVQASLESVEGCQALISAVKDRWDSLHLLVNNASAFDPVPFEEITPEQWESMLGVNLRAPFLLSQGLLPLLEGPSITEGAQPGEGNLVVHLTDIGAERPIPGYAHYSVSKAGLVMLIRAMAVELSPRIRVAGVAPGQVIWPPDYPEELRERIAARIPIPRVGTPEDVAKVVRFLSLDAPYLNGLIVPVDGGRAVRY